MIKRKADTAKLLPLDQYDLVLVSYSGGKDSIACLLYVMELGVEPERIELWHQDVGELMDWPCTRPYVVATARTFNLPLVYAWREGGFEKEMLRRNEPTAPVLWYGIDGNLHKAPTKQVSLGTRLKFPQVGRDLQTRWCTPYLKINVMDRVITNDERLLDKKLLVLTGERAQESPGRATYAKVDQGRGSMSRRLVHHWRPVLDWHERKVWEIIERWKVDPHPCYKLGWGRCSCMTCIFGNDDQWASVREIDRDRFVTIAAYEELFGCTIHRDKSVIELAERGDEYVSDKPASLRKRAMSDAPFGNLIAGKWELPAGAYKTCGGPC